jgi:hypothetical protein
MRRTRLSIRRSARHGGSKSFEWSEEEPGNRPGSSVLRDAELLHVERHGHVSACSAVAGLDRVLVSSSRRTVGVGVRTAPAAAARGREADRKDQNEESCCTAQAFDANAAYAAGAGGKEHQDSGEREQKQGRSGEGAAADGDAA